MKINLIAIVGFLLAFAPNQVISQKFKPVEEIPDGKALVYIYRPGSMNKALIHYTVNDNDKKVNEATLKNKTYLVHFAEPGTHMFWALNIGKHKEIELKCHQVKHII